ncbi:cytochrome b [Vibrio ulleungensis]|uniref:Cytochrome b/b6 domain-containing protein n=1 Tax=Vibrio ulleungensis TaxID=2807619 RepID=A0ABS2HHT1_9VIBR|nr:cytochrome b/b6 domain-containing protein [Vibrio ulleungensis]MBM7036022.1 cytochrome b/b6 domain-containing protein [Vibrio ulleungensis]
MDIKQQSTRYDLGYRLLHWVMAFLFVLMLLAGQGFASATTEADRLVMLTGHSSIGSLVIILLLIRLTKRFVIRSPRPVHPLPSAQRAAALTMQYALYLCMIAIPVTGILTAQQHELAVNVFGTFNLSNASVDGYSESTFMSMRSLHESAVSSFKLLLIGHIGAALFHGFVKKDGVLRSMWFKRNKKQRQADVQKRRAL